MKEMIWNMDLKPSERLKDYEVAGTLGVSNTPVREALRRLEAESLVETLPRKGTFVKKLTIEEVEGLYEVREALETLSVRLFAERAMDNAIDEVLKTAELHANAIQNENKKEFLDLDHRFHELIAEGAGNIILSAVLRGLSDRIRIVRHMDLKKKQDEFSGKEHLEIAKALAKRDSEEAVRLMKEHIQFHSMRVLNMLKQVEEKKSES
jgi:DNA-binding GntR family transcriptional regulator